MESVPGPSPTAPPPHVTKQTIHELSYYQLFNLPDPLTSDGDVRAAPCIIDAAALTRAYRRFSLLFHPDKDGSPEARAAFDYVKDALDTLIDEEKRSQYDRQRGVGSREAGAQTADAGERRRQQQAAEDADWAAEILKGKEAQQAAAVAAKERAAAERDEAMRRMHAELTSSLDTPFAMMESAVIRDWDVDEELLAMKLRDVAKLMEELGALDAAPPQALNGDDGGFKAKRHRAEDD